MRIGDSLKGKRVLITQCEEFMGPVLTTAFEEHGAVVIGSQGPLADPASAEARSYFLTSPGRTCLKKII